MLSLCPCHILCCLWVHVRSYAIFGSMSHPMLPSRPCRVLCCLFRLPYRPQHSDASCSVSRFVLRIACRRSSFRVGGVAVAEFKAHSLPLRCNHCSKMRWCRGMKYVCRSVFCFSDVCYINVVSVIHIFTLVASNFRVFLHRHVN